MQPKILILTASFGDGHNSAARNLASALHGKAEVILADPCDLGNPTINRLLIRAYRQVTTYAPRIWAWIYRSTDKQDFSKPLPFISKTEKAVAKLITDNQPDVIVNTYPIYPHMVARHFDGASPIPIVTIITDSLEINAAWSRSPSHHFLVTDHHTEEVLINKEIPEEKINITGFPVSPLFETLPKIDAEAPITKENPFRVLFFPTARSPHVTSIMEAVLAQDTNVTVVLGRNTRWLYKKAHALKQKYPNRIKIKGWTKKVPELLTSHHLVIGKAGGATVHEAIAAQCPMLVHQIVPGQEEGNIELLERYQTGALATTPVKIKTALTDLLANDAKEWREQKRRLLKVTKPLASHHAADFILSLTNS